MVSYISVEKIKSCYERNSIKILKRVYKHYYFIIRAEKIISEALISNDIYAVVNQFWVRKYGKK